MIRSVPLVFLLFILSAYVLGQQPGVDRPLLIGRVPLDRTSGNVPLAPGRQTGIFA